MTASYQPLPPASPQQLIWLLHDDGGGPAQMAPLAARLRQTYPQALMTIPEAPHLAVDRFPEGRSWWPSAPIPAGEDPDAALADRVTQVLPSFLRELRAAQRASGVGAEASLLIGLGAGGTLALEAVSAMDGLVGRVVALGSRYATLPDRAPRLTTLHWIHGKADDEVPFGYAVEAAEHLVALGGDVTADVLPFEGHGVSAALMDLVLERLQGYLPRRRWDEAMRSVR